ncbi:MAG: PilZ domain-containing protein [Bdellovibrionales bacterium]|nr:PilZ domain-containing protein [Bdellovibrionales bacterium]
MEKPAPRLPLKLPIEFRKNYSRKSDYGDLQNISLTGAFLVHDVNEIAINDKINIHFKVSGRERTLQASVVWLNSDGCGLQFHPDNNRDVQIVDDLMYFVKDRRTKNRTVLDSIFSRVS